MGTKLGKSVTVWMLKSTNTNSFLAIETQSFVYPSYWLCPYYEICENKLVIGAHRVDVEERARQWNKAFKQLKVKPIKVRVSLESLAEESTDEK